MVKDTYVWYDVMIECSWIICILVQVGDWRNYHLEENNKGIICIFRSVHNKFNTVLKLYQSENTDTRVVLNNQSP
jgi:hypothetical protein